MIVKNKMVKVSKKNEQLFNQIFKNQFGYLPLRKGNGLLRDEDVTSENLSKLQLMGYVPYVVECLDKLKNPSFRDVVKLKGTALPTSCGTLGSIYNQIGFIGKDGKTMIKGKNFDKFLTTKWDWFVVNGSLGLIKGETYPLQKLNQLNWVNRYNDNFVSSIPKRLQKEIILLLNGWSKKSTENKWDKLMSTPVVFK
jgi:hypothetical protein